MLLSYECKLAKVVRVAQSMTAAFISEVRLPVIMEQRSFEFAEDSGCIHRFFSPLFMRIIMREEARRSHMQPMESSFDTQAGLVRIQHPGMTEKLGSRLV